MKHAEAKSSLNQDLKVLEESELDARMRAAVIYRSERKKILHSQLHVVTLFQNILERCDQAPSVEETFLYFKRVTLAKSDYEKHIDSIRQGLDPQVRIENEAVFVKS